jgi:hypothetical protein
MPSVKPNTSCGRVGVWKRHQRGGQRVVQGCGSTGGDALERRTHAAGLQSGHVGRIRGECDHADAIVRVQRLSDGPDIGLELFEGFPLQTSTGIDHERDVDRKGFRDRARELLRHVVVQQLEILAGEPGHRTIPLGHGDRDEDRVDPRSDRRLGWRGQGDRAEEAGDQDSHRFTAS